MEPKTKESGSVGNEKESPISTSKSTKPRKTSTTASSSTNSTHHKAEVKNYLKTSINIHSQSLKTNNNNDSNQQNNQKPTMNGTRLIDKASSHLQKLTVSPCPRCRNQQFRCASISSKFSSRPIFTDNTNRTIPNKPHQQLYPKKKNTTQNKKELANVVESKESLVDHKVTEGDYHQVKDQISENNENADHSEANKSDESNSCRDIYVVCEETKAINDNVDEEKAQESSSSSSSQVNEEDQGQDTEQKKDIESREIKLIAEEVKEVENVEEAKNEREENKEKYKEEKELKEEEKEKVNNIGMKKDEEGSVSSKEEGKRAVKLRHQSRQGSKKESPDYNYVIEETASKLLEKRKNKVRALVGAFETVIDYEFNSSVSNNLNCIISSSVI